MSSDSDSNSEVEDLPNKKAKYEEEGEDDGHSSRTQRKVESGEESEEGDEEDDLDSTDDRQQKRLKLKERGARTDAILRQPHSPTAEEESDEAEGKSGDAASEDEPFDRQQRPTNGADKRGENEGDDLCSKGEKRRSRKKPAKYLDDDFDEFDSSEDEKLKSRNKKKSKYDDDDDDYEPAKEELDRYSRRAKKQVNFDNSMFFDSEASSGDDESYRPSHWKSGNRRKREASPVYSSDSDDLSFQDVKKEEVVEESDEVKLTEEEEYFALAWNRFLLFSRFTPSTKELSTDRPHALLCEQWDAYTADKTQITAFLHVLRDACKYKKAHLEEQFEALQRCITRRLPKLDTLLAAKKVIGKKVPKRLVKSMTQTVMPNHRWRRFHKYCVAIGVNPFLAEPVHVANFIAGLFLAKDRLHADSPTSLYPHSDFYRHNIAAICEQLGRYMKQSQVSGGVKSKSVGSLKEIGQGQKVAESLLETPEMTALIDAADQITFGNFKKGSLAWRLAPPYSYPRYLIDTHSKSFWQHGLVRRIVRDVKEGVLDLGPAASQLHVSPDMLHSALGKAKKIGGDLTVQQYMELDFGGEEQFWGERTNVDLVEGARQGNIDLHTVAFSTGVTLREITERVGPIEKKKEVVVEKKPKASNSSKGPQLTDLQKQILAAEEKESSLSEYEKMRLENMRERQAMLEMLSMEEEKEELRALVPKRESKKVDYGVREKSSRLKRKADTRAMQGKQASDEWTGMGRTRHSPLWVGRWWVAGAEVPPPRREELMTGLVDRGQDFAQATSRLHRLRVELAEVNCEKEKEIGSTPLLWDAAMPAGLQQPTGASLLTSVQAWRDIACFADNCGRLGLQLAGRNVVLRPHGRKVSRSILLPQCSSLLSGSHDGTVRLTDLVADKITVEADFGTTCVEWVEVEEENCWLAGMLGRVVRVDQRESSHSSSLVTTEKGELGGRFSLNHGKTMLAFAHGTHTSVFDLRQSSKALHSFPSGPLSSPPSWSPSGRLLLSSSSALQVWDLNKADEAVLTWPPKDQIHEFKDYPAMSGQARYIGARAASWCPWSSDSEVVLATCSVMRSVGNTGDCAVVLNADTGVVLAEVGEESPQAELFAVAHPSHPSVLLGNSGANGLISTYTFPSV